MLQRYLILVLIILFLQTKLFGQISLEDLFEMKRISCDFKGSVTNGKSLLVFGEGGVILKTTDVGKSWEQINLNDYLDINQMLTINQTYFGNGTSGIFKSNDDFKTWEQYYLNDKIIKIFNYKGNLLCVAKDIIIILDTNLRTIKQIDIKLEPSFNKPIKRSSTYYSVELCGDNLVFYSKGGKFAFFNLETEKLSEIELKNFKSRFDLLIQKDIKKINEDKIVFLYEDSVMIYKIGLDTVDFFFKIPDTLSPQKFVFYPYNDTIFVLYTRTNQVIDWDSIKYSPFLDSVYYGYIDPQSKKFINIKEIENDYSFNDLTFLNISRHRIGNSDVLVGVGIGKLINISYDLGRNWELKSLLNIPYLVRSDYTSLNFKAPIWLFNKQMARIITQDGRFYSTDDGGTTWLPQKNFLPRRKFFFLRFAKFIDSLRGMYISDEVSREIDSGKIVTPPRQFFSLDGGKTVGFRDLRVTNIHLRRNTVLMPFGQPVLFISPNTFYILDDSLKIKKKIQHTREGIPLFTDSIIVVVDSLGLISVFEFNDTLWGIAPVLPNFSEPYKYQKIDFCYSADMDITWSKLFQIDIPNWQSTKLFDAYQYWDTLLLHFDQTSNTRSFQTIILLIDLKNKNYNIFVKPMWGFTHIFQICSQYYLFSSKEDEQGRKQTVFVGEKFDSAHQNFQEYEVPRFLIDLKKSTSFESYSFDVFFKLDSPDSTFPFVLYDKLFGKYALYFAKIRPCVEINIPRTNSKDLYVGKIYPNPANRKDIVNFRIYSNHLDKIETLSINAYDILGREVANSSSFRISQIGNHFVDVELEINALSPGVYIIVASMDGMVSSNAVVIY